VSPQSQAKYSEYIVEGRARMRRYASENSPAQLYDSIAEEFINQMP